MQVVILCAGKSSRLYPLNNSHKSLISIAGEPIISHTLRSIKKSGITDVILVTGPDNLFRTILGDGKKYGLKIKYAVQNKPTGMGDALICAAPFINSDFFLINAHRVEFNELKEDIDTKRNSNNKAILLASEAEEKLISSYGSLKVRGDRVLGLVEKPKNNAPSNLKVIGIYFLNQEFIKVLRSVKPQEYSLETALDEFAKADQVRFVISRHEAVTLKYPWDLIELKNYLFKKLRRHISKKTDISKDAKIIGPVFIEDGAVIFDNAVIKGPCYIGRNSFVGDNCLIRNGSSIEQKVKIGAFMEIKNSLILEGSSSHSGFIGDSIIGRNCKIGALFGTANVRLDRGYIKSMVKEADVETNLKALGAIIGDNTVLGSRVTIMPGVIIGNNVNIGPSTTVMKNIPSNSIFYTKFLETVQKNKSPKANKGS